MRVWIYVDLHKNVGDVDYLKVFVDGKSADIWLAQNDPAGAAFAFEVNKLSPSVNEQLIDSYLTTRKLRKLHIGCGSHLLEGWLNSDYDPVAPGVTHLDATKPFPLPDATFDFIFSEHMIEHVRYPDGCNMLRECFRVLKPGGTMRVSTPDLKFLIELYSSKTELQRQYIKWAKQAWIPWAAEAGETFVINNFVRDWGHRFIYDEKVLRQAMERAGFTNVERCELQRSRHQELHGLDNERRCPLGFLRLETLTLEGSRQSPNI